MYGVPVQDKKTTYAAKKGHKHRVARERQRAGMGVIYIFKRKRSPSSSCSKMCSSSESSTTWWGMKVGFSTPPTPPLQLSPTDPRATSFSKYASLLEWGSDAYKKFFSMKKSTDPFFFRARRRRRRRQQQKQSQHPNHPNQRHRMEGKG